MPDEIELSVDGETIAVQRLNGTTPFYKWLYDRAPLRRKAHFNFELARGTATGTMVSTVSPIVHGAAIAALAMSRRAYYEGEEKRPEIRERLAESARRRAAPADGSTAAPAPAGTAPAPTRAAPAGRQNKLRKKRQPGVQTTPRTAAAPRANAPPPVEEVPAPVADTREHPAIDPGPDFGAEPDLDFSRFTTTGVRPATEQ